MKQWDVTRSSVELRLIAASLLLALAGCATSAEHDEPLGRNSSSSPSELARTLELARSVRPGQFPLPAPRTIEPQPTSTDKGRNTIDRDISYLPGSGVVLIWFPNMLCTGQVINERFLLTAHHCVRDGYGPEGEGWIEVSFTDTAGNARTANSTHSAALFPDGRRSGDKDVALVWMQNAMATCQGPQAGCATWNVPVNSMFQYFPGSQPVNTASSYEFVGYGGFADSGAGFGVLNTGTIQRFSAGFTEGTSAFGFVMTWQSDGPRPCVIDSGSPLYVSAAGMPRPVYTGFLSRGSSCETASGNVSYTGLTESDLGSFHGSIMFMKSIMGYWYDCAVRVSNGVYMYACDNDGSVW